jgi:hypothetical protein
MPLKVLDNPGRVLVLLENSSAVVVVNLATRGFCLYADVLK